ncbi:HEAT repeat domain-containing protein, partial [Streptomyces cyaneofuscatus]|uniref:HEAT repeat domain-containing protein n=1 Tax=Streptomyces cyaneofuscatus TaxID=66883 RepID=UPI003436D42D
ADIPCQDCSLSGWRWTPGRQSYAASDPLPDVVRMAVRTLGRASWEPALPELVRLLQHPKPVVRSAAREAVTGFGPAATPALRRAAAHARPDRRSLYTDLLAQVAETGRST